MASLGWMSSEMDAVKARRDECAESRVQGEGAWGLALSGGGIRSATFCLGMIKALARNKLLNRFDYLSTVSGGGYAGAALGRVYQSVGNPAKVQDDLAKDDRLLWWWLRNNGRYLLPAGARDTLFAVSSMMRGTLAVYFDLFVVATLLACILVFPHLLGFGFGEGLRWMVWSPSVWWLLAAFLPFFALAATWSYWFSEARNALRVHWISIPFALVAIAFAAVMLSPQLILAALPGVPGKSACAWVAHDLRLPWKIAGEIACLSGNARFALSQVALSLPLALVAAIVAGRGGDPALARNRLSRFLTLVLKFALVLVAAALVDMASWWISGQIMHGWPAFAKGGAALMVLLVAGRALVKWLKDSAMTGGASVNVVRLAKLAGVLIAFLFLIFVATFVQLVVFQGGGFVDAKPAVNEPEVWAAQGWSRWVLLFVTSFLYILGTGWNVASLNNSSLHNFYRARLTRSYLGVGNRARGFDPDALADTEHVSVDRLRRVSEVAPGDDVPMDRYKPHEKGGPIHLINVCLNQTVDDNTGEFNRDRNGRNMTVSSLGCDIGERRERAELVYAAAAPTLGQWVAISGAAAAPGMGANTSKGLAALFTFSGVRLGYWLDLATRNGKALGSSLSRRFLPKYVHLLDEMLATFPGSDAKRWYVSDGGHFENTAVYALIKREARVIVAADCGADPKYTFGDLNNLVRLARVDFNARITFMEVDQKKVSNAQGLGHFGTLGQIASPTSASYLMLAKIEYQSGAIGYMIILKPTMMHTLPLDLITYKSANPAFPQQTTADQFFDEAQWESYFRLGEELGNAINCEMLDNVAALAENFVGHMGSGLSAAEVPTAKDNTRKPEPRVPRFAGQVVKSSLGIGAVAGLLMSLWQVLEEQRAKDAAEHKAFADAVARAIERATDNQGELRATDSNVIYLQSVLRPGETRREDIDYGLADQLVERLYEKARCKTADADNAICIRLAQLKDKKGVDTRSTYIAYWPDSPDVTDVQVAAAPAVAPPPVAPAPSSTASSTPAPPPAIKPAEPAKAEPPSPQSIIDDAVAKCRSESTRVRLFLQVYRDEEGKLLKDFAKSQVFFAPLSEVVTLVSIENVVATAQVRGTKPPYRWTVPTFIYHDEGQRPCAEALAAVYENYVGPAAKVRPLPQRMKGQPGVIELWVPEGGVTKLTAKS